MPVNHSKSNSTIAVITARGGSKRIPRKNIKDFCGKPIIAYSIEAAFKSALFDEVMVSTDDGEIAEIARRYGASVPFMRSVKASDDYATTTDVLLEVLDEYRKRERVFEALFCIYPTAPFVTGSLLRDASALLMKSGVDMVQPVVEYDFPPQRSYKMDGGLLSYWMPECENARSQDLPKLYHDAGQFYGYKAASIQDDRRSRCPLVLDRMRVQDIDTEEDWALAEAKFRLFESR